MTDNRHRLPLSGLKIFDLLIVVFSFGIATLLPSRTEPLPTHRLSLDENEGLELSYLPSGPVFLPSDFRDVRPLSFAPTLHPRAEDYRHL